MPAVSKRSWSSVVTLGSMFRMQRSRVFLCNRFNSSDRGHDYCRQVAGIPYGLPNDWQKAFWGVVVYEHQQAFRVSWLHQVPCFRLQCCWMLLTLIACSRLFYLWATPLFRLGFQRPLKLEDLWGLRWGLLHDDRALKFVMDCVNFGFADADGLSKLSLPAKSLTKRGRLKWPRTARLLVCHPLCTAPGAFGSFQLLHGVPYGCCLAACPAQCSCGKWSCGLNTLSKALRTCLASR